MSNGNRWPGCGQDAVVGAVAEELGRLTDAEAIERSLDDPQAFVTLFDRHFSLLHRYLCVRGGEAQADDLTAATFEVAFRRRGSYDGSRTEARPWLFGIALNVLRDARRSERRQMKAFLRLAPREEGDGEQGYEEVEGRLAAREVNALLAEVPAEDRDLLLLFACVELTYEECAQALGIPVGTVRSRLHRLRARLRARLEATETDGSEEAT